MNRSEIASFLKEWDESKRSVQKVGFLYGYYAEDPNYKEGVRAIIEAV